MLTKQRRGVHAVCQATRRELRGPLPALFAAAFALGMALLAAAPAPSSDPRAEAAFRELEGKLLHEKSLRIKFRITSEGPVTSSLQGQLRTRSGNRAEIEASGTFRSKPVELRFESDGKRMRWTAEGREIDLDTPKELNAAIIVGFTRMGLLHNVARLIDGKPPDHAAGGVDQWVEVSDFVFSAPDPDSKVRGRSVRFRISVDGEDAGEANYWISPLTRVPVERRQTVRLEAGDVKAAETYDFPG